MKPIMRKDYEKMEKGYTLAEIRFMKDRNDKRISGFIEELETAKHELEEVHEKLDNMPTSDLSLQENLDLVDRETELNQKIKVISDAVNKLRKNSPYSDGQVIGAFKDTLLTYEADMQKKINEYQQMKRKLFEKYLEIARMQNDKLTEAGCYTALLNKWNSRSTGYISPVDMLIQTWIPEYTKAMKSFFADVKGKDEPSDLSLRGVSMKCKTELRPLSRADSWIAGSSGW